MKLTPGEHPVLRDEHLRDLIRECVLLTRGPFNRNGDSVAQAEPKELSCQLVDRELRAAPIHDPHQILGVHLL